MQSDKKQAVLMCACPVAPYISLLALIHFRPPQRPQCNMTVTSSQITFDLSPPQTTLYYVNYFYFLTFIMIKSSGHSSSDHCKGFTRSGHACNIINGQHLSKRDEVRRGKFVNEEHKKLTGKQPCSAFFEFGRQYKKTFPAYE